MPTPAKPFKVLTTENKSHRTKAELKMREEGEKALSTEIELKERKDGHMVACHLVDEINE